MRDRPLDGSVWKTAQLESFRPQQRLSQVELFTSTVFIDIFRFCWVQGIMEMLLVKILNIFSTDAWVLLTGPFLLHLPQIRAAVFPLVRHFLALSSMLYPPQTPSLPSPSISPPCRGKVVRQKKIKEGKEGDYLERQRRKMRAAALR